MKSHTGNVFRVHQASLDEYIRLSKRLVTPVSRAASAFNRDSRAHNVKIYPADAQVITGLLDIHVPRATTTSTDCRQVYEILEAGTGHGSLTLYLSRAIHAANVTLQAEDTVAQKAQRHAILHTVDVSAKHSAHAQKIVGGFRHGLYANNVDFHVGDISRWIDEQMHFRFDKARQPFLQHAILDLPDCESHLAAVASALHVDARLVVFAPSITQIIDCCQHVKQSDVALQLDQVVELQQCGMSGGRQWDVRAVTPRAERRARDAGQGLADFGDNGSNNGVEETVNLTHDEPHKERSATRTRYVCRPKVGGLITGGGFLAVFCKQK